MQTGTSLLHIPYRGNAPAVTDLMGGQIQLLFTGAPAVMSPIKNGQLGALAVSSPQRLSALPAMCPPWLKAATRALRPISGTAW